jgi:hypothetical protein
VIFCFRYLVPSIQCHQAEDFRKDIKERKNTIAFSF